MPVTLLLLMLFTAMLPILWIELTALGKQVAGALLLFAFDDALLLSRSLLFDDGVSREMLRGNVTLLTMLVVFSVPSSHLECLCNHAFFNLCTG